MSDSDRIKSLFRETSTPNSSVIITEKYYKEKFVWWTKISVKLTDNFVKKRQTTDCKLSL